MKKNIFPLLILSLIFCSCQKEDNNGDFGGMWRLTEIVKSDGSITDTKEKNYFWKVQLELIKIGSQFGRFQNTGDFFCFHAGIQHQGDLLAEAAQLLRGDLPLLLICFLCHASMCGGMPFYR